MTKPADLYFLYGQGDAITSPGIVALANKYRQNSSLRVRTECWYQWIDTIKDINARAAEKVPRLAVGFSMGGNALTWILGGVMTYPGIRATFDWACFIDPTTLSIITPLQANRVKKVLHFHNNSFDPVGHANLTAAADFNHLSLEVVETYAPHLTLDLLPSVQQRITNAIDAIIK